MNRKAKDEGKKKAGDKKKGAEKYPPEMGDPEYGAKDDIYARDKRAEDIDPDNPEDTGKHRRKDWPDEELDIPGAELDDADEEIGEEDEENNYYSLGGDNHDDLEEDRGE